MSVAYFDDSRVAKPRGFWGRLLDRIVEVRMEQARRILEGHGVFDRTEVASSWHHHVGG